MKKRSSFLVFGLCSIAAIGISLGTLGVIHGHKNSLFGMKATDDPYSITLDSTKTPAGLTDSYQQNVSTTIKSAKGNDLSINIVLGKREANKFVNLTSRGMIYNFGSPDGIINGLNKVTATFSGVLLLKTSAKPLDADGAFLDEGFTVLTSGTPFEMVAPTSPAKYFALIAGDGGAVIESLKLDYTCNPLSVGLGAVNGTYTGVGNDGLTWQLDLNNGNAVIHSLDKDAASQDSFNGTYEFLSTTQAKCTFNMYSQEVYYTVDMTPDGKFNYVSKSDNAGGAIANNVAIINFAKVFNIEDFENYSEAGYGYDQSHNLTQTTGVRAQFICDYKSAGSSPIGGSEWKLMGSSDYIQFNSSKGHNGSKAITVKGNGSNPCRYIQANALFGVPAVSGKGAKLSFWAKGAYSDNGWTTQSNNNATIKALAYYEAAVNSSNHETALTTETFTITAKSDWKEYTMALDATKNYYAIGFVAATGNTYTPIDDIKIYTTTPYAVPPVHPTSVELNQSSATLKVDQTAILVPTINPANATNQNLTWSSDDENVAEVNSAGIVSARSAGTATITCTTVDGGKTATFDVTVEDVDQPYFDGTYTGVTQATIGAKKVDVTMLLAIGGKDGKLTFRINNNGNPGATSMTTFDKTTGDFTIETTDEVELYTGISKQIGTISGRYDKVHRKIVGLSVSNAEVAAVLDDNGSIELELAPFYYGCEDSTLSMQKLFKRRYGTGAPWTTNSPIGSDQNWQTRDTTNYLGGASGMSFRVYTGGKSLLNLRTDLDGVQTYSNISFWIYNPNANALTIRMWTYSGADFTGGDEIGSVTAAAGEWSFCCMGFNTKPLAARNFQIMIPECSSRVVFENIALYE